MAAPFTAFMKNSQPSTPGTHTALAVGESASGSVSVAKLQQQLAANTNAVLMACISDTDAARGVACAEAVSSFGCCRNASFVAIGCCNVQYRNRLGFAPPSLARTFWSSTST